MRVPVIAVACGLLLAAPSLSGQRESRAKPEPNCANPLRNDESYSESYFRAAYDSFKPTDPDWRRSLIRIQVEAEEPLFLWTDGDRFKLLTYSTTPKNVDKYLLDLADSCRLPGLPSDATWRLKVKWESVDLSELQFAEIHSGLTHALSQYVLSAQSRYDPMIKTKLRSIWLDAIGYRIVYENSDEYIEVKPIRNSEGAGAIVDWVFSLQKLANSSFHRPFGGDDRENR